VDRRYIQFFAISLAIIIASQALQTWLFPRPPKPAADAAVAVGDTAVPEAGTEKPAAADRRPEATQTATSEDGRADDAVIGGMPAAAPRVRRTLGSLDPAAARMLVTLTSRGAAVERIELADEKFHDQDDRSGYLGHLAAEAVEGGCRVGVVGPGTPAARAGLKVGDVIAKVDGTATPDADALREVLATTKPRRTVTLDVVRDGSSSAIDVKLDRRPLEVVRPEYQTAPVDDPDGSPHDPLSFRLSLESRDGRKRPAEPLAEIPGLELADVDWQLDATADPSRVRFTRTLPGGLTVAKEYRLAATAGDGQEGNGYGLELVVQLRAGDKDATVAYALDGPTGLPTEGWWYAQRVARDWGSLAVRDVAVRFTGKPGTMISGLKIADGKLEHPSSRIGEGTPLSFELVLQDGVRLMRGEGVVKKVVVGPIAGATTDFTVNVDCTPGTTYDKTAVVLNQAFGVFFFALN
jgi:hypothetical protein